MPAIKIQDGRGTGQEAGVNGQGQLETLALSVTAEHFANAEEGKAFHIPFEQVLDADDAAFLCIENTGKDTLLIEGVTIAVDRACQVYFKINDIGTCNASTVLTPANVNSGSGFTLPAIVERGGDLAGGEATLGGGFEFDRLVYFGADNSRHYNFEADVVLQSNGTMTIWCDTAATEIFITVVCYIKSMTR